MRLSEKTISAINNKTFHSKLALALDFTDTWVRVLIAKNKENGPLTTIKAIQLIQEETGLSHEEILEVEPEPEKAGA